MCIRDRLSDEDYKTLTDDAAKVRKLEDQLQALPPEEGTTKMCIRDRSAA